MRKHRRHPQPGQREGLSRRALLTTTLGAAALTLSPDIARGQEPDATDTTKRWGRLPNALGARSPAENPKRTLNLPTSSRTPLQDLHGTITPSDLHYERHHAGLPVVDPRAYRLLVHGMVDRPLTFTLDEVKRFPAVTRTCFLECAGNFFGTRESKKMTRAFLHGPKNPTPVSFSICSRPIHQTASKRQPVRFAA